MREILFRGKTDKGEWVYGVPLEIEGYCDICYFNSEAMRKQCRLVIPETVGQYTGLKDKNGRKIFEGDIVTQPVRETRKHSPCLVEFKDGKFQAHYISNNRFYDRYYDLNTYTKIIGNIHDNPELLKGGEG